MNALLFSLPGTPVLYYGDEIGMGDNIYLGDRNGVRTPMQWSGDRNAGFSRANPQRLYLPVIVDPEYHYEALNVEAQLANPSSLLWWTRRLIALRKRFRAFGRGSIEFIYPDNRKVLAFIRRFEDEHVLVVANLSRFVQYARLGLSRFAGSVPIEVFGRTEFPALTDQPYFLTLGPHAFYWFQLQPSPSERRAPAETIVVRPLPVAALMELTELLQGEARSQFERVLPSHLLVKRWFQGKARAIRDVRLTDFVPVAADEMDAHIAFLRVEYIEDAPETYVLPLALTSGDSARSLVRSASRDVITELTQGDGHAVLFDALGEPGFRTALLGLAAGRRRVHGEVGELHGFATGPLRSAAEELEIGHSRLIAGEQSNSSIVYGADVVLKLYRRLEEGTSLDLELGRFLTEHGFANTPAVMGAIEYVCEGQQARTVAIAQRYVANEGNAWELTIDTLGAFFEHAAAAGGPPPPIRPDPRAILRRSIDSPQARSLVGTYAEDARILGKRTAEMHLVLASDPDEPAFAPEPFTMFYQRSLYQSMRNLTGRVLQQLAARASSLPRQSQGLAQEVLAREGRLLDRFRRIIDHKINAVRFRVHGDYHLGQLLYTGNDFFITDFEGEPIRPLSERRIKRSPLRDVAGMLRSFHYAANVSLLEELEGAAGAPATGLVLAQVEPWAKFWYSAVAAIFLEAYLETASAGAFLPADTTEIALLLDVYLLEKAVYELSYEMNNRPDWSAIPLTGLLEMLEE
ncbi:MAG: putative maltokinase [Longimicrobiales bacterium]